jgi:hypothetical protein
MATKLTVALVGGIVMVVSISILIVLSLTSPSRCVPRGEPSPSLEDTFANNSTTQPGTVLSTVNGVDEEETSPSTAEEASDRQPGDDGIDTVTLPANISTTVDSGTTLVDIRKIIIVPPRKCTSEEKRDRFGVCRKKW